MKKSILMVTPAYPPYDGSHTQRMLAISKTLVEYGHKVYVMTYEIMTGHPTYNPNSLESIPKGIEIVRVACGYFHRKAYKGNNSYVSEKYGKCTQKKSFLSKLKTHVIKAFDKRKNSIFMPDSIIDWKKEIFRFIKKNDFFKKNNIDLILSCEMPASIHLICYGLSSKYRIPLILDYGDPWVFKKGYKQKTLRFKKELRIETKILKRASLISFSTEGCERLYREKFPFVTGKTLTIMTGYDDSLLNISCNHTSENGKVVFTYGGAIQDGVRNPYPFFEAINSFKEAFFLLRTNKVETVMQQIGELGLLEGNIKVENYIPFEKYYSEMLESDVLVFFGNSTPDQLPGKIFNYLPTKKLILYISNIEDSKNDQALNIVKDYGYYVFSKNNVYDIKQAIQSCFLLLNQTNGSNELKWEKYSSYNQIVPLAERIEKDVNCNE